MLVAFLLLLKVREKRLVYGEDFYAAGTVCLVVAFLWAVTARLLKRKKKSQKSSYWLWGFLGSGIAMIILGYAFDALNPGASSPFFL